jgi:hypothetical protein
MFDATDGHLAQGSAGSALKKINDYAAKQNRSGQDLATGDAPR